MRIRPAHILLISIISIFSLILSLVPAGAQTVRISGFTRDHSGTGAAGILYDTDGEPCSVLRMETPESGWTFEAGLDGIVDVVYGKKCIYVYVPACARSISVAKPGCTPLRDWAIPVSLEPGMTYRMKLEAPEPAARMEPDEYDGFAWHFVDAWTGFVTEGEGLTGEKYFGIRYSYMQHRVGPYASVAFSTYGSNAIWLGGAYRFTKPLLSDLDFQAYGGVGLIDGKQVGGEAGIRFGWKSSRKLSGLDFGVGCQFFKGGFAPTVEVGLYIWGVPVVCGLCLIMGAL